MKKALFLAVLAAGINSLCGATPNVVFEADFTQSPDAKRGDKIVKPYPVKNGTGTKLETDPERGLIIGENKATAYFSIKDLLKSAAGSIEISVRNVDWDSKDRKVHLLLQADQPGLLFFYKHSNDGAAVYFSNAENKQKIFLHRMPDWREDTVHHCVFTWNGNALSLYIDGTKAAEGKFEMPAQMPNRIFIGSPGNVRMSAGTTAIRSVKIYDAALTPAEVAEKFRKNLPQDKDILDE
ncbi:MAG: LamG domain-containing protein [Lentisphaeria bacterium]|nr:LamG domain-containing protein [Lentisphaeria bacterium]